jgi:hypothetical protein
MIVVSSPTFGHNTVVCCRPDWMTSKGRARPLAWPVSCAANRERLSGFRTPILKSDGAFSV